MENSAIQDSMRNLNERLEELASVKDKKVLLQLSTDYIASFMSFQSLLINRLQESIEIQPEVDDGICTDDNGASVLNELQTENQESEETSDNNVEIVSDVLDEDDSQPAEKDGVYDDTPKYVVFYAKNHASYISINEHNRCVLERNIAKAFYVPADANGIAKGQNLLSRYDIDKYKPLTFKFLTQKEFDDTIGRAIAMSALMKSMPVMTSDTIDSNHKVSNFATGTKSSGKSHIGDKPKSESGYVKYDDYSGSQKSNYDFFRSKPYTGHSSSDSQDDTKTIQYHQPVPLRTRMESPLSLYKTLHYDLDEEEVLLPSSIYRDVVEITDDNIDLLKSNDIDTVIELINCIITEISHTKSGWLTQHIHVPEVTYDYLMDFDYAKLSDAIDEWNSTFDIDINSTLMYIEDFDPTIRGFVDNVSAAKSKYNNGESLNDWVGYAFYNFVRCIIAYDDYMYKQQCA